MRVFEEKSLLFTPDVGRMENQGDLEHSLSIYAPINSDTYGVDAVRIQDGAIIPSNFYVGTDITGSLVSFWELDEQPSGTRIDVYSSNNLSDNNTVTSIAGLISNAALFNDANSEYLSSSSTDFDLTDSFTISGWVYFNNYDTSQAIVSRYVGSGPNRWSLHFNSAQSRIEWQMGVNTYAVLQEPSAEAWHFYCAWFDDDVDKIYLQIDNGTINEIAVATPPASATRDFHLGAQNDAGMTMFLDGRLDHWGVWSRILTIAERTYLYNSGVGRPYSEMEGELNNPAYTSDSWSNTDRAVLIDVNSRYDLYVSGSDINAAKGTFSCLYRADYDYNDSDVAQRYLLDGDNFIQIYYDYAAEAFYGQLYSGAGYTELIVSGANQTFVSGTWLHIGMAYDSTKGLYFFVSGTLTDAKSTIWEAETSPANLSIGYISGSGSNSGQGGFDDIRVYKENLTIAEIYRLSLLNVGLN